jgi:hypothetical protein
VIWTDGVAHQTKAKPLNRVLFETNFTLKRLLAEGHIDQSRLHLERARANELVRSIEERRVGIESDEDIVYPHDPRHVLLQFVPEDERHIDQEIEPRKCVTGSNEYFREWRRLRKLAKDASAT